MSSSRLWMLVLALVLVTRVRSGAPGGAPERMESLRAEIRHHDELYFRKAAPEITDANYDRLKRELAKLEQDYPPAAPGTPEESLVGDDRSGNFPSYRHRERMLSLEKSYSETELRAFHDRLARLMNAHDITCVVEPKFDGLAISVTYEKGKLIRAVTRGNGVEGDDVTPNILAIDSLPRQLRPIAPDGSPNPIPDLIEIRGEVYLPLAEFARLNREREAAGELPYAHPRNLAAGTLKQLDPDVVAERHLAVVFYGWGACEPAAALPDTQQTFHRQIHRWGLPGVENIEVVHDADEMWKSVRAFQDRRRALGAPTDGAVVKLDSVAGQQRAGASSHAPHWAMAFKFPPDQAETRLESITVQVGRTGILTPVAEIAPVQIGGTTIARATLHNRDEIARRDIRIGDTVYVEKAGEVIPAIVGVDLARRATNSRPYDFPTACPSCGARLIEDGDAATMRCPNYSCPAQLRRRLQHFASEACVDITGLGAATIEALVSHGDIKSIPDIYRLHREDLAAHVPGFSAGKSCDHLFAAIERSKRAELWRVIHGLGIPQVGATAAKDLAWKFNGLDALIKAARDGASLAANGPRKLRPTVVAALVSHFSDPRNREVVTELIALGMRPKPPRVFVGNENLFSNHALILTGAFLRFAGAQALGDIRALGRMISEPFGAITKAPVTGYVVALLFSVVIERQSLAVK